MTVDYVFVNAQVHFLEEEVKILLLGIISISSALLLIFLCGIAPQFFPLSNANIIEITKGILFNSI
jgi:hypothetical protein